MRRWACDRRVEIKTASAAYDDGALRRADDDNPRPHWAAAVTSRYSKTLARGGARETAAMTDSNDVEIWRA